MKEEKNNQLPFWREYPDRDTEFVRVYPTLYGELNEEDVWRKKEANIYLHIPFCDRKCVSCTYIKGDTTKIDDYLNAMKKEISLYASEAYAQDLKVKNIYFGGGTPSVLDIDKIGELISLLKSEFDVEERPEISVEVTPTTIDKDKALKLYEMGVTRLSVGIQSFVEKELKEIKRGYKKETAVKLIQDLKEIGFTLINIDLMVGIPGQSEDTWRETLSEAVALKVDSISFYTFFLLETSDLMTKVISGKIGKVAQKDLQNEWFYPTYEILSQVGYEDISSCGFEVYSGYTFAKKGCLSKYYSTISKKDAQIIGLGAFASGHLNNHWYYNISDVNGYVESLSKDELPLMEGARIEKKDYLRRLMILGLQTGGVSRENYFNTFGLDACNLFGKEIEQLVNEELVELSESEINVTKPKGFYYISNICKTFYDEENNKQPQYLGQAIK